MAHQAKMKVSAGMASLGGSRESLSPSLLQLLEVPLSVAPSSEPKGSIF